MCLFCLGVHSFGMLQIRIVIKKTGSWDNAIQHFSLAYPSWYTSDYTMLYKYGKHMHAEVLGASLAVFYFSSMLDLGGGGFDKNSTHSCWMREDYIQLGAACLIGYVSYHVQYVFVE